MGRGAGGCRVLVIARNESKARATVSSMNTDSDHDAIVRWLAEPAAYPHRPERVEHIQTHISDVFIAGEDVYKLKKPVKFDFLDFSAPWRRKHWCREEVELNRRLAPDTYLNIVPVTRGADGNFQLGGAGPVVDWLVYMRRLPTDRTLDALHRCGALRPEDIERLINTLVPFYRALPLLPITPPEYRDRCLGHVRGNLRGVATVNHHLPHNLVER